MKSLVIDIETAPNVAHVWSLWDQNVSLSQLIVPSYTLCFAAKWHGERGVVFERVRHHNAEPTEASRRKMLDAAHALLSEADAVIHYNGASFDIPRLNAEFMELGYKPPAPFKQIDLKTAVKKVASFPSHKLQFVSQRLGIGSKVSHEGHDLWRKCIAEDAAAWARMQRYNEGDVLLTERLYNRVLPWIPSHPNKALYAVGDAPACPHCASKSVQRRGLAYTATAAYARYRCNACGAWSRGKERVSDTTQRRVVA